MSRQETFEAFKQVLVDRLQISADAVTENAKLMDDLDLDSIDVMTAVMGAEEQFSIDISDDELEDVVTVGDAVNVILEKVGANA